MLSLKAQWVANHVTDIEWLELFRLTGVSFREFLTEHHRFPIIAVTGQSGVGKTTFTNLLMKSLEAQLREDPVFLWKPPAVRKLTELPQMSPYLPIIKASNDEMSDQMLWEKNQELFRVLDEAVIAKALLQSKDSVIVMDFSIIQVLVYAILKIHGEAGREFRDTFERSFAMLPKPDFLVHVTATPDTVIKRLRGRGSFIDAQVERMTEALHGFYSPDGHDMLGKYYADIPLIRVHTDQLNLIESVEDQDASTKRVVDAVRAKMVA